MIDEGTPFLVVYGESHSKVLFFRKGRSLHVAFLLLVLAVLGYLTNGLVQFFPGPPATLVFHYVSR